jgi:hypothetical protein
MFLENTVTSISEEGGEKENKGRDNHNNGGVRLERVRESIVGRNLHHTGTQQAPSEKNFSSCNHPCLKKITGNSLGISNFRP